MHLRQEFTHVMGNAVILTVTQWYGHCRHWTKTHVTIRTAAHEQEELTGIKDVVRLPVDRRESWSQLRNPETKFSTQRRFICSRRIEGRE